MFIDKDLDLHYLNLLYRKKGFHLITLYSKSGLGKTTFLNRFSEDKETVYFSASETIRKENFNRFKEAVVQGLKLPEDSPSLSDYHSIFNHFSKVSRERRLLVILDEYQNFAKSDKTLHKILEEFVDGIWKGSQLFLIVCLPSQFYKTKATSKKPQLTFSESLILKLRPFTFFEMCSLVPNYSLREKAFLYGVTSGIPRYLSAFLNDKPFYDNLYEQFFCDSGQLFREPSYILNREFRDSSSYHSLLTGVGSGLKKLHEIAEFSNIPTSAASNLLQTLSSLDIVRKSAPVTENPNGRKTMYMMEDFLFRFWYTYIVSYISPISQGYGKQVLEQKVLPEMDSYMELIFEDICRQYLLVESEKNESPFHYDELGRWWGQHPTQKRTDYISIAAANEKQILLGNSFWEKDWIDINGLYDLMEHGSTFPDREKYYYLFAREEFATGLSEITGNAVRLVTLKQMCDYCCFSD